MDVQYGQNVFENTTTSFDAISDLANSVGDTIASCVKQDEVVAVFVSILLLLKAAADPAIVATPNMTATANKFFISQVERVATYADEESLEKGGRGIPALNLLNKTEQNTQHSSWQLSTIISSTLIMPII